MIPARLARYSLLFLLLSPHSARAQAATPKIGAIHVKGLARFKEAQVLPLLKIERGAAFQQAKLIAATNALGDTGAFEEVRYAYRPENGAVTVEFLVKEAPHFRHCIFDNFPFATSEEIVAHVQRQVPLFDGSVPDKGSMIDEVGTALEALAKSHGVTASAQHTQYGRLGSKEFEYMFRLIGPTIQIASVRLSGMAQIPESELVREAKPLLERDFSVVQCRLFGANVFAPYYRERGFLKVDLGDAKAELAQTASGAGRYDVQVTYPVTEGLRYQWDGAQWEGNQTLTAQQLNGLMQLKAGEVANEKKIQASWEAVAKEYSNHGYIRVAVKPAAAFSDDTRKVQYRVQVNEGTQFHMGALRLTGFPQGTPERVQSRWKLKPGDVFDASYVAEFLRKELGPAVGRVPAGAKISETQAVDAAQATVDVLIKME